MTTACRSVGELDRPRHATESVRHIRQDCCRTLLISTANERVHHKVECEAERDNAKLESGINPSYTYKHEMKQTLK